jgi:hypothetical protein
VWSAVHTCYNFGAPAWFYVGFDVYDCDDLDSWYPAYVAESLFYVALVTRKLTKSGRHTTAEVGATAATTTTTLEATTLEATPS